jgi:hypothetical protein
MTQAQARAHVASQIGGDAIRLSSLLDSVAPTTLAHWTYIAGQYGHASPKVLREACVRHGATVLVQTAD